MIEQYGFNLTPSPHARREFAPFNMLERDFYKETERQILRCANGRALRVNGEWRMKPNGKLSFRKFTKRHDYRISLLVLDPEYIKL